MKRIPLIWKNPESGDKHEIWGTPDIKYLLEEVIETEAQAEDFFAAYEKVSAHAEDNLGYYCFLIKDEEIREDAADLFMIELHNGVGKIFQTFGPSETPWGSSYGIKVIDGKRWSADGPVEYKPKAKKAKK